MFRALLPFLTLAATASPGLPPLGHAAPAFDLEADDGSRIKLADLKGKVVVLAFFPQAFTPG